MNQVPKGSAALLPAASEIRREAAEQAAPAARAAADRITQWFRRGPSGPQARAASKLLRQDEALEAEAADADLGVVAGVADLADLADEEARDPTVGAATEADAALAGVADLADLADLADEETRDPTVGAAGEPGDDPRRGA